MPGLQISFSPGIYSSEVRDVHQLKKMWSRKSFWGFLGFSALLGLWLSTPGTVAQAARDGLRLCAAVMIPSLFPFFVISNLFVRRGYHQYVTACLRPVMEPVFGLAPEGASALALGAVGGYPIGAATAFQLYDEGILSEKEAARLLAFCNNAGPGFIFGVVGLGLLGSAKIGAMVFAVHLVSAALVGVGIHLLAGPEITSHRAMAAPLEPKEDFPASFIAAVQVAAATMLNVCAFLVFFAVMLAFLRTSPVWSLPSRVIHLVFGLDLPAAGALLDGLMELSTGISHLQANPCDLPAMLSVCSFLLGWGGLCVHCQVLSLRGQRPIRMTNYFVGKLCQGLIAAILIQFVLHWPLLTVAGTVLLLLCTAIFPRFLKKASGKHKTYRV